jgi:hypothetical protein
MDRKRFYAFKFSFAIYMIKTRGGVEDYRRFLDVQKEALEHGVDLSDQKFFNVQILPLLQTKDVLDD